MKIKEIERTGNIAWSPASQYPIYVATATAAQQLDATFSTSASVELWELDLSQPGLTMNMAGSMTTDCRFHKLVWGAHGMESGELPCGTLVGGGENGSVYVWKPSKLLEGSSEDCTLHKLDKHVGAVSALDINPFQTNLLASGASESDIYIWDLNNPGTPMTPGTKSQPPDDVTCLAWNRQVQHILASTYAGRCVVWDLRKNEPIIKVSDSMSRIKCKLIAWHPDVATQLCLASEDDHTPVIQLWDLRFATSPLKSLENHQRGLLSMAWCPQDPDLLLSCGKDNRILCWNPNSQVQTGEVIYELPTSNQWSFDVQWCPRNPAVISSCSFDGHVSIYSLMGGDQPAPISPAINKIAESFPADPFAQAQQPQLPQQQSKPAIVALKKAPKWLRRPVGASFGFGGKLITFENEKPANPQQPVSRSVVMSQVVTETELVTRSNQLESALGAGQLAEFCALKVENSSDSDEQNIWSFMKVQFEKDPRNGFMKLLGYDKNSLIKKVEESTGEDVKPGGGKRGSGIDAGELAQKMSMLDTSGSGDDGSLVSGDDCNAFDEIAAHEKIVAEETDSRPDSPLPIAINDDFDGLVTQALLMANFGAAVEVCLHHNKMAEAIILAIAGGPELLVKTQKRYFKKNRSNLGRLISSLVTRDFEHIVRTCELENWKEALGVALTYAKAEQFADLCGVLGARLESERSGQLAMNACLCYICAGNVEKLVSCWSKCHNTQSPSALQDLVEKVMILQKAVERASGQVPAVSNGALAMTLSQYAALLASQGSLHTAINYLGSSQEMSLAMLRDRLNHAMGQAVGGHVPSRPFNVVNVQPAGVAQQVVPQPAPVGQRQRTTSGPHSFQSTAASNFQTTTTPSSTYYTQTCASYGGAAPGQPQHLPATSIYGNQPQPSPTLSQPQPFLNGPLSQKYPATNTYPRSGTPTSGIYDPYSQQNPAVSGYQPPGYNTQYTAPTSQPNIYNPTAVQQVPQQTPGAPYVAPGSQGPPSPTLPMAPSFQEVKPQGAWNDPPMVKAKTKTEITYEAPAPITTPIFGVPQPVEQVPPGAPNYGTQMYNPQQYQQQQYQQQQSPAQQQQQPVQRAEPVKPIQKGPIPDEHQVLQQVLEKLANQCLAAASSPQIRRKLEDVLRKLEALYDKLREDSLSAPVITGLHQIIQSIQQFDYATGLSYHSYMVSQANFSEISTFMPGVKMLMQTAMQMQVFVL